MIKVEQIERIRRFFCDNDHCDRVTFAERLLTELKPYARRTDRLGQQQQELAFAVGGEAGARLLKVIKMPVSPDTVLRLRCQLFNLDLAQHEAGPGCENAFPELRFASGEVKPDPVGIYLAQGYAMRFLGYPVILWFAGGSEACPARSAGNSALHHYF